MPYDRDAICAALLRYYELLVKIAYLEDSEILRPPPTGWTDEELAVDLLMSAGRSERAIDMARHLPYLRPRNPDLEIYPPVRPVSYLRADCDGDMPFWGSAITREKYFHEVLMPFGEEVRAPKDMLALSSDRRGEAWVLDVSGEEEEEAVVWLCDYTLWDEGAPEEEPWRRGGRRFAAEGFFGEVSGEVEGLVVVPVREPGPWFHGGLSEEGEVSCL